MKERKRRDTPNNHDFWFITHKNQSRKNISFFLPSSLSLFFPLTFFTFLFSEEIWFPFRIRIEKKETKKFFLTVSFRFWFSHFFVLELLSSIFSSRTFSSCIPFTCPSRIPSETLFLKEREREWIRESEWVDKRERERDSPLICSKHLTCGRLTSNSSSFFLSSSSSFSIKREEKRKKGRKKKKRNLEYNTIQYNKLTRTLRVNWSVSS